ncbi:MAG: response regulator [Acidobacteria bacterium]|nr:response regulator [Acidobacteriota bacterium]
MQKVLTNQVALTPPTRILLVEDNPGDALLVEEALSEVWQTQYELMHRNCLDQGLRQMDENGIDVILLDLSLPDSDGLGTLYKMNAHAPETPIIILSGFKEEIVAIKAVEEGAQDYLVKGQINSSLLGRAIQYAIERKRNELALRHTNAELDRLVQERTVELAQTNVALVAEIAERTQAQHQLQEAQDHLEMKIKLRTVELAQTNEALLAEIAERQELEERLVQAQKMEAIGRLAGGVAHDFNNILTAIIGFSQLLLEKFQKDASTYVTLKEIEQAGQRAAKLTSQLLAFSRKQMLQPRVLNLNLIMINLETMLRRIIGEDIELVLSLDPDLNQVKVDPTQMDQVILNLAVNARDAMPQGGQLILATANVTLQAEELANHGEMPPGQYVLLTIRDTGCGIDEKHLSKIFDPFFTTKETGKGTGLGLATVYGIVRQSGGYISVTSQTQHGTTFKLFFPCLEQAPDLPLTESRGEVVGGKETILLVEDEEVVRRLAHEVLKGQGYKVLVAACGDEAISLCNQYQDSIHLLVTDVVMPQMSGAQVREHISRKCPHIRVLFMSGYMDQAITYNGIVDSVSAFIQKPFTPSALLQKIRAVLDAGCSTATHKHEGLALPSHEKSGQG